ncbi:hypothetical protein [Aureimonas sp. AU40]|uniref:hypothetical protein n=1 Tax=Aureimonas sp. AU40 TaxID=1637747 RepID=UPI0012E356DC|nr:hypothetical protein [Aureimonas sp. AU40]
MELALRAQYPRGGWKGPAPSYFAPAMMQKSADLRRAAETCYSAQVAAYKAAKAKNLQCANPVDEADVRAPIDPVAKQHVARSAAELAAAAMVMADTCSALFGPAFHTLGFHLESFSRENRTRCEAKNGFNQPLDAWSLSDWMTATLGELGEAANVVKKLNRVRDGIPGNDRTEAQLRQDLSDELADAFIYLDLMAQAAGVDLPKAVRDKFDRTSAKIGYVEELPF